MGTLVKDWSQLRSGEALICRGPRGTVLHQNIVFHGCSNLENRRVILEWYDTLAGHQCQALSLDDFEAKNITFERL
jgi:hypothetical protein